MERQAVSKVQKMPTANNHPHTQSALSTSAGHTLLELQRAVGNQAIRRLTSSPLIQAKLQISTPEDPFEQEADRVAESVMRMPEPAVSREAVVQPVSSHITPLAQRETDLPEKKDKIVARKSKSRIPVAVREDGDEEETLVQRVCDECEDEMSVQRVGDEGKAGMVQRAGEEESVQRDVAAGTKRHASTINHATAKSIGALDGHGGPLPEATRSFFEPRFGVDFSQVRVHTDLRAAETAKSINSKAFTVGRHIAFGSGQYSPHSHEGQRILAHELMHVVQQGGGGAGVGQAPAGGVQRQPEEPLVSPGEAEPQVSFGESEPQVCEAEGAAPVCTLSPATEATEADEAEQQAAGPSAGGCAAEGETVDEQRDEAAWAGHIAHMQIQNFFSHALGSEAPMPRATKEDRSPGCRPSGTPFGKVDLWHYDNKGNVQIAEIKSVHGKKYAAPEVLHYIDRFEELASRIQGGPLCEDDYDLVDEKFDAQWVNSHLIGGRVVWPRPLDSFVPWVPITVGPFWLNWNKNLKCKLEPGGAVIYWCTKNKDDERAERIWDAVMLGIPLTQLLEDEARKRKGEKKKEEQKKKEPEKKKEERKRETPAATGGGKRGSRLTQLASLAANATMLGRIAKAHIQIYGAFASWAYTGMYWGTRGYDLNQTFKKLADVTEVLALDATYAEELDMDIATVAAGLDEVSAELETAGMRAELLSALEKLRMTIVGVAAELNKAMQYTAIWTFVRLDWRYEHIRQALNNADTVLQQGDDSLLSLSLVVGWEVDAATWLLKEIGRLFSLYEVIVKHDQINWLKIRK